MQCAGGADYPCFGKGECNTESGTCQCDPSANVNDNCSVCNDGWFGEDCSIAYSGLQGTASTSVQGAQWLSGRVLDLRPRGCGLEPHQRHSVVVL